MSASRRSRSLAAGASRLKAAREAAALSLQAVATRLDISPQAVHQFEKNEAAGTISLRQLANVARAMGFRFSYELTPARGESLRSAKKKSEPPGSPPSATATEAGAPVTPPSIEPHPLDRFSITSD